MPGDYKNNPIYTDITKLDHLSPSPVFNYNWNKTSGFWEPAGPISIDVDNLELNIDLTSTNNILLGISGELSSKTNNLLSGISGELSNLDIDVDSSETNRILSGVSGQLSNLNIDFDSSETNRLLSGVSGELSNLDVNVDFSETNILLSGISGELSNIHVDVEIDHDTETHKLLSGISGELSNIHLDVEIDHDSEAHRILSGVSGAISSIEVDAKIHRKDSQQWKLRTKTVNQKIEEDFILLESIPESSRYGQTSGYTYGLDRNLMDDIYGTHFSNSRMNISSPEIEHPNFFIHSEYTDPNRGVDSKETFHTDTLFSLRQENVGASLINSYELEDYNNLYKRGLVESVMIHNNSPYPIQFHTEKRRLDKSEPVSPKSENILYLDSDMGVKIKNDEAGRIFIKRPHTISGFTISYAITYKATGETDVIE